MNHASYLVDILTPEDFSHIMGTNLEAQPFLGDGGFGSVYRVQLVSGRFVAVKVFKKRATPNTPEYVELTKEAALMANLAHENIIRFYGHGYKDNRVFYVMEYANNKSIWDKVSSSKAFPFGMYTKYSIEILNGLCYLHQQTPPVAHHDLKPENILLCDDVAKICDFGISIARDAVSVSTGRLGTIHYAAPESFKGMSYGIMTDIYMFALVVWAMIDGSRPYQGMHNNEIMAKKLKSILPSFPPNFCPDLQSLLSRCWDNEPRSRPSAADVRASLVVIQKDSRLAPNKKHKPVRYMSAGEVVSYLTEEKILSDFINVIEAKAINGEKFLELEEKDLLAAPFCLSSVQSHLIFEFIRNAGNV